MSTITDTVCEVKIRRIHNYSTTKSLEELERHILHAVVTPSNFDWAKIDYNKNGHAQSDNYSNPGYYPLKFISKDRNEELWISCVTLGYHGEGPSGCTDALKLMGFILTEQDEEKIFTTNETHLEFKK